MKEIGTRQIIYIKIDNSDIGIERQMDRQINRGMNRQRQCLPSPTHHSKRRSRRVLP